MQRISERKLSWSAKGRVTISKCSCSVLSDLPPRLLCPWNSPGKNTGVDCHSFLQGILPSRRSNLGLQHCRQVLYCLSDKESPPWKYRELNGTEIGREGRENSRPVLVSHVGSAEEKTACNPGQPWLGAGPLLLNLSKLIGHVHPIDGSRT